MHAPFYSGSGFGSGVYSESGLGSSINGKWLLLMELLRNISVPHFIIINVCVKTNFCLSSVYLL